MQTLVSHQKSANTVCEWAGLKPIIHGNICRSPTAYALKKKIDIVYISEPGKVTRDAPTWVNDDLEKASGY